MRKTKYESWPIITIPEIEAGQIVIWKEKLWYFQGYAFKQSIDIGTAYTTVRMVDFWTGEEKTLWPENLYEMEIVNELPDSTMELKDELNKLGF